MKDYIERKALRDALYEADAITMEGVKIINQFPAADVRPVVRGKWTLNKDGSGTCSECGFVQNSCWDLDNWDNFCHHCGADMRGENK